MPTNSADSETPTDQEDPPSSKLPRPIVPTSSIQQSATLTATTSADSRSDTKSESSVPSEDTKSESKKIGTLLEEGDPLLTEKVLPYIIQQVQKSNRPTTEKNYCVKALEQLNEGIIKMAGVDMNKLVRKPKMFNGKMEYPKLWLEEHNFEVESNSNYTLRAANNLPLPVLGITKQVLSYRIRGVTKSTLQRFVVAKDLPQDILLGRDWQKLFKITVDNSTDTVSFADEVTTSVNTVEEVEDGGPVFAAKTTSIPARSQLWLPVKSGNSGECIILPDNKHVEFKVANATYGTDNDKKVLVMNPTPCIINVQAGTTVARFESTEVNKPTTPPVNLLVTVDEKGNTINVGDNLNGNQIADVRALMDKYYNILAFNGQIGKTHATEHRIDLVPGA